ncbi:hypothetical protein [Candidatus Neoehrlichia procyonis]|uniref:Putative membrane protein n=1 Tax=Candidatus Neoehrlichia procyonis str. RAC413 TaxID=1359163 RepID=A0A0F3NNP8_9RICK|nr:hypothetical protein [Candidatus Neoehrlichia lotoris]KJV69391.1 putative membrane protein [Candidatus Neoehrlichia lotoris str. RAC413]
MSHAVQISAIYKDNINRYFSIKKNDYVKIFYNKSKNQDLVLCHTILKELYNIEKINYVRQTIIMTVVILSIFISMCTLLQSSVSYINILQNKPFKIMELLAVILCGSSLLCGILLVGYIERKKKNISIALRKIQLKQLVELELQSYMYKNPTSNNEKVILFLNSYGNSVDLFGTMLSTIVQTISFISMVCMIYGYNLNNKITSNSKFNLQYIGIVGAVLCFISPLMFLIANILQNKNKSKENFQKIEYHKTLIFTAMSVGTGMVLIGKILLSLKAMHASPIGIITIIIGRAIYCAGYAIFIYQNSKNIYKINTQICNAKIKLYNDKKSFLYSQNFRQDMI